MQIVKKAENKLLVVLSVKTPKTEASLGRIIEEYK
jgi:hypothetical protein